MFTRQRGVRDFSANKKKKTNPEELSIFALLTDVQKATDDAIKRETDYLDLPNGYRNLLYHLAQSDGVTQLDISRITNLTPPTISISLRKMEAEGLVTRQTDPNDLRQTRVFLTEKGREAESIISEKADEYGKLAIDCLSDEEKAQLKALLIKVRNNVIPQNERYFR